MKNQILHRLVAHARLPLFRNGYALMVSAATTSGLGVVYWMLATRSYSAEVVGMNSAIISAMLLVSGIAQLSLLSVMARFLPRAGQAAGRLVATAYALTLTVAAVAGLAFVVEINTWAPALAFLGSSPLVALWFTLATMMWLPGSLAASGAYRPRGSPAMTSCGAAAWRRSTCRHMAWTPSLVSYPVTMGSI